jgi:pyruvate dehydrogenase E1 component
VSAALRSAAPSRHAAPMHRHWWPVPALDDIRRLRAAGRRQGDEHHDGLRAPARRLLKDPVLGPRVVPIVADEARTFGMANLFRQVGIYSRSGQQYEPEDIGSVLAYREAQDGQILEEGISEAGALARWTAAATSHSVHGEPMLPFYIYYSMFGFQRVGDQIWAAADQRARGFLLGATAGRTTLAGEGLQHQDGTACWSPPRCPTAASGTRPPPARWRSSCDHGMQEMLEQQRDVFYYLTLMNENQPQPSLPPGGGRRAARACGVSKLHPARFGAAARLGLAAGEAWPRQ